MDRDDAASVFQPTRGAVTSSSLSTSSLSSASPPPASTSASPTAPTTTPVAATAAPLARSVSQTSAASSTRSHRSIRRGGGGGSRRTSSRVPTRSSSQNPQPHAGSSSASVTSEDNKSLTSFPSFSPKAPSTASPPLLPTPQRPRLTGPTASTASLVDSLLADDGRALLPVTGPSTSTASTSSVAAAVPPAASSSSSAARSALFDDSDAPAINYGDLHLADDAHVARLVGRHGAIALVRQLAEDLARRDTQVAALRARAADRERFLRKIILECGLSSLDLATRLRALEQEQEARLAAAAANTSIPASHARRVSDLLGDAMSDDHSPRQASSDYYYNDATIRAASAALASSSSSVKTKNNGNNKTATSAGTTKGWKDYLWGGTTKKAGSGSGSAHTPPTQPSTQRGTATIRVTPGGERRPTIRDDLFQPPTAPTDAADPTNAATDDSARPTRSTSRASSVASAATSQSGRKPSLASLALRLVGGGSDTPQDSGESTSASAAASLRNASGATNRRPGPPSTTLGRSTRASTLQSGNNNNSNNSNNSNNNSGSVGPKSLMAMRRSTSSAVLNGAGAVAALNGSAAPQAIPSRGVGGAGAGRNKTNGNGHKHQDSSGGGGSSSGAANERWGGEMMDASPSSDGAAMRRTTYFPVEMDTILPLDVQPPTLTHMYNRYNSSGHLIDRFGFIYDQRRKKRQREAAQVAQVARHAKRGSRHSEMLDTAGGRVSRNGRPSPPHVGGGDDDDAVDTAVRVPDDDQASTGDASSLKNDNINDHDADSTHRPPSVNLASTPGPDKDSQTSAAPGGVPKRWQDYLKIATFPTELLSHTPAMNDTRIEVITEDGSSTVSGDVSGDAAGPKSPGFITSDGRGFVPPSTGAMAAATTAATTTNTTAGAAAVALDTDSIASSTNTTDTAADQKKLTKKRPPLSSQAPPTPAKEDVEPVRLLLQQLSELHDALQKERTVRWNEFLRKVRAERRREGEMMALAAAENIHSGSGSNGGGAKATMAMTRASMPETRLADGEIVGVAGLGNKGKLGRAKWNEFRALVLGGIPVLLRAKVWSECTGATSLRVPGAYDDLVAGRDPAADAEDPDVVAQIQADIHRTLTDNIFFREGPGTAKLNEVLLAYARRNPDVGYCQGMNLIAANLLLVTPSAEDAFWLLASIVETILPVGYYDHSLAASRADQQVLRAYVADVLPRLSAHFDALSIDLETMTFQWFLSVFTDCLSAEVLFRVWDVVFCLNDGSVFLFQVALALLKLNEAALLRCETPAEIYTYINHQMTNHAISIDGLVQASEALRKLVRREDVEARRAAAMDAERALVAARAAAVAEAKASRQQKLAARDVAAAAAATETAVTTPVDAGPTD
ncbi:tbc domain protein [Sporothrix brasiliensis 5110]|uniref:Tbc domain protein n=1 Tax=Sporothrix brasiliensis 5110 TaxID=1398154 RepID=A0A0C2FI33_9PEZI|nr:tbc domain protein [Sporothrix brasiliensis 5110]KIH90718.1 tbc domain protein [Sporothrix brasiliensis 5110]